MPEEEKEEKPKSKKMLLLIIILLLIISGGAGAWYFFMGSSENMEKKEQAPEAVVEDIKLVNIPPFLVNLSDPLGRRFIKLTINVEVSNPVIAEKIEKNMFQVRDKLILLLSSKTYGDLSALDSKIYLKNEIAERINQVIAPDVIRQVYISDMIIQ